MPQCQSSDAHVHFTKLIVDNINGNTRISQNRDKAALYGYVCVDCLCAAFLFKAKHIFHRYVIFLTSCIIEPKMKINDEKYVQKRANKFSQINGNQKISVIREFVCCSDSKKY